MVLKLQVNQVPDACGQSYRLVLERIAELESAVRP
jgi:hypothetical protein